MCEHFVFGGPFGLPIGLGGWLAHHFGGFFLSNKVRQPTERKISIQNVLSRIHRQEVFLYLAKTRREVTSNKCLSLRRTLGKMGF
jgi:hypothetical protein